MSPGPYYNASAGAMKSANQATMSQLRAKGIVIESILIAHHFAHSGPLSLLDPPKHQINGGDHAGLAALGVRQDVGPNFFLLHDPPDRAIFFAAHLLPYLGQALFPNDLLKIFHGRLLLR